MAIFVVVLLFALMVGAVLVAYGAAKNKWGINLNPVSCPRCNTPLPSLREPRSLRQAMWGGWTCPVCGAGVDRRGREITPIAPRTVVKSEAEMWRILKRRVICGAPVVFGLFMLIDWMGITHLGFPSNSASALLEIATNVVWTVFLTGASLFLLKPLAKRINARDKGGCPRQEHASDHDRGA